MPNLLDHCMKACNLGMRSMRLLRGTGQGMVPSGRRFAEVDAFVKMKQISILQMPRVGMSTSTNVPVALWLAHAIMLAHERFGAERAR